MPKRTDLKSILIIGAGPIIIGQACEFDYSGTQACRVLMAEGIRVILVNSNPATIMTDPEFADATYVERSAFCRASVKLRPMAIASPTDFMWVVSVGSASGNFSKAKRGTFTTT